MKFNSHNLKRSERDKEAIHALPFEWDPTPLNENEGYFYTRGMEREMTLNELAKIVNLNARNKGFYNQIEEIMQSDLTNDQKQFVLHLWNSNRLLLIISELTEGFEGMRNGNYSAEPKSGGLVEELGDAQIRLSDFTEDLKQRHIGFDFEEVILNKHNYNQTRPYMHGGKKS